MRWYEPPKPSHKESRTITKFLFFPMTIGSETRWLETATWFEVYWKNVGCGEWVHVENHLDWIYLGKKVATDVN